MRPAPCGLFGAEGETTAIGVSSSLNMRSLAAIADCSMLYFSLKSMIGRKNRIEYWMNAISTPSEAALPTKCREALRITSLPPHQITEAMATEENKSTAG